MYQSLSISGLITLELHALNNEGAEGNTMMTRMVDIIDQQGQKHSCKCHFRRHVQAHRRRASAGRIQNRGIALVHRMRVVQRQPNLR